MNKSIRRKIIIPSIYLAALLILTICVIIVGRSMTKYLDKNQDLDYSNKEVIKKEEEPVMAEETAIIKPYTDQNVKIGKSFYDYQATSESQERSIIYYENTYMQNSGVDYVNDTEFDVINILDGEVIDVKNDKTLGNIVEVKHDKEIISIYQGLNKVNVKKGDKISQSDVVGTSGKSEINPNYKSCLHFEVFYKGEIVNPENFYTLNLKDLK